MKAAIPSIEEVRFMTLRQAAFLKYMENCFFATKVTFFNEMHYIYNCLFPVMGIHSMRHEFDEIVEAIGLDPRVGRSHTQVPGPDGKYGYGGHCLPKDLSAMRNIQKMDPYHSNTERDGEDISTPLLDAVYEANKKYRMDCDLRR